MDYYFETKDLAVGYNGRVLIKNISIGIHQGEVVTLIGPNGAGKSTILKSITKHLQTIAGTVWLDGSEINSLSYKDLARRVAVVLTERVDPELMTCWDVVAAGRYPYTGRMGILSREDEDITAQAMETVHVLDLAQRSFHAISDGQRQRILLARAICQQPEIIVLDEPTSFLDIRHKLELLSVLRKMAKEQGITVILSLHEIDLAQKISDRLICVKGDHIAASGTPDEIFRADTIRALYDLDNGTYDPTFGSVELPRLTGKPEVFVLSACGTGIPVFRQLRRDGVPFAAGVLYENDIDCPVARALAAEVVTQPPFVPISRENVEKALALMQSCRRVIVTDFPKGPGNVGLQPLLEAAEVHPGVENH